MPSSNTIWGYMFMFLKIFRCILCCEDEGQDYCDTDFENSYEVLNKHSSARQSVTSLPSGSEKPTLSFAKATRPSSSAGPLTPLREPVAPSPKLPPTSKSVPFEPPSNTIKTQGKTNYVQVEKLPIYVSSREELNKHSSARQFQTSIPSGSEKPPLSSTKATQPSSSSGPLTPFREPVAPSPKPPPTSMSVPFEAPSNTIKTQGKTNYVRVEKLPIYVSSHEELNKHSSAPQSQTSLPSSSEKLPLSSTKATRPSSLAGQLPPLREPVSPSSTPPPISKSVLFEAPSSPIKTQGKTNYVWLEKLPIYVSSHEKLNKHSSAPQSQTGLPTSSEKPPLYSTKVTRPSSLADQLPPRRGPVSPSPTPPPTSKSVLFEAPSSTIKTRGKTNYVWVEKLPIYVMPEQIKSLIKKDIVPEILKKPVSPLTYKDYFAALLYAEEFYAEKWSDFQLKNVILELNEAEIYKNSKGKKNPHERVKEEDKTFVKFDIDTILDKNEQNESITERRPFLLSRDLVYARPSGSKIEPFQGIIHRVVKSSKVLVEFGNDFYLEHFPTRQYDISFSFNRICLKRAHQSVEAASVPLFQDFIFPDPVSLRIISTPSSVHEMDYLSAVQQILRVRKPPPCLVRGPLCVEDEKSYKSYTKRLSTTGILVRDTICEIYQTCKDCRILVCAPVNSTCDMLTRSLKKVVPDEDLFRANATFREIDGVPIDILPSCLLEGECFACPSSQELEEFRVILSTYISSYRLHSAGISAGHFSHIFLLDATSTTEPETMVALINFADEKTAVIMTGAPGNRSGWVRSEIAREYGLRKSYFERLSGGNMYKYG